MTATADAGWSSSRTSLSAGPLTTLFTPPADCPLQAAITSLTRDSAQFRPAVLGFMPGSAWASGFLEQSAIPNTCYPEGTPARQVTGFFSPGVYCPFGWTTALTFISSQVRFNSYQTFTPSGVAVANKLTEYFRSLLPSETMVLCCPGQRPQFTIDPTDVRLLCRGHYGGTANVTLNGYGAGSTPITSGSSTSWLYSTEATTHALVLAPSVEVRSVTPSYTITIPFQTPVTATGSVTAAMEVFPIQIRWQPSDESLRGDPLLGGPPTGSSRGGGGAAATETVIVTAAGSISTPGIAGIAVGCTAGVLLVTLAVFFILRYRRNRLAAKSNGQTGPAELPASEGARDPEKDAIELLDARRMELGEGGRRWEMGAGREHWELGEGRERWELNGETGYWELGAAQHVPGMYELDVVAEDAIKLAAGEKEELGDLKEKAEEGKDEEVLCETFKVKVER